MFPKRIFHKFFDFIILFAVFFTPLLFFTKGHDQFELPKLTFLTLLAVPALLWELKRDETLKPTPLSLALLLLLAVETLASLPLASLSWQTSLLGDYENFAGLSTFILYLLWFRIFNRFLSPEGLEKLLVFNSLAALLSALYAIGQHFQLDFVAWNPGSVVASREFGAMGNPNFLSAYLAMSLPLFLSVSLKTLLNKAKKPLSGGPFGGVWASLGLLLLLAATGKAASFFHLEPSSPFLVALRGLGLGLLSFVGLRFLLLPSGWTTGTGVTLMILGLLSTGSRGGFLGALFGLGFWALLSLRNGEYSAPLREIGSKIPKIHLISVLSVLLALLVFLGHGFFIRLLDSVLHMGQSLATSRLHIWGPAVKMAEAKPVLGVGLDTFKIAFPYYSGIGFNEIDGMFMSSRMAHNELLQMASTTGFLGLAAYLGVLGTFVFMGWRAYQNAASPERWTLGAVFASALAYQVQNFFSFGVAGINLLWFLLLAIAQWNDRGLSPSPLTGEGGVGVNKGNDATPHPNLSPEKLSQGNTPVYPQNHSQGEREFRSNFFNILEKPFLILLLLLLSWFPLNRLGADIAFGEASAVSEALKNPDSQVSAEAYLDYSNFGIQNMKKAVQLCPLEVKYHLYLGLAYEQRAQLDPANARDWDLQALACYQKAVQMSPYNAYYYNDEGRMEDALGRFDPSYSAQAEQAYANAVHWNPSSPFFNVNWSLALQKIGRTVEASQRMQKAFELDPFFTSKILAQMAFQEYRSGDKAGAFGLAGAAIQGNTTSAEAYYARGVLYLEENKKSLALRDFETVRSLNPTPEKNPSVQGLDQLIEQAKK